MLDTGYQMLDTGYWMLDKSVRDQAAEHPSVLLAYPLNLCNKTIRVTCLPTGRFVLQKFVF